MKPFRDQGIQKKMHLMTLVICGAVLLVATVALFSFQVWNFRANFQRDTVILSQIIASNSTAAVAFKDVSGTSDVLNALKSDPAVISASIFLPDDSVLAHYGPSEDIKSRLEFPANAAFVGGQLLVTKPIYNKNDGRVGTLYLRSDFRSPLLNQLKFYGQLIVVVLIISFCLGALLSGRLSRTITDPVRELAKTAMIVGEKKDYSVRVAGERRGDELGRLMDSFNDMLGRIQSQDAELSRSRQKMEALIHSIDGIVWERTPDDFKFTFISRQSESVLGYAPQAWLDQPDFWAQKLHPQDAAKAVETGRELAARKQSYAYEYRMLAADGRIVWIRESGMVLVENGRPTALRGILQDITRQKLDAEQLDKLNRQLLDTSRQAGMADVATGVLHNVGNVLNSVSVAATVVGERLQRSKIIGLQRATALMREQNGRLADYLTADPKGKLLPQYIDTVADQLAEERNELIAKVQSVAQNIEHIKEIVAMQQSYAKVSGAYENLLATELVDDALRINVAAFDRHHIQVVRQFSPGLPSLCVDRHKVLQVLINLLRNAKHAMEDINQDHKQMVITIARCGEKMISIAVRDNGIGIPPTNLTKIFNHGFTTKKDGHGFGLHSGANAAKEMGGSLTAASDGPGKGAEFTLKLPIAEISRKEDPAKN
jgi:PAS domain S-box-containing protein